MTQRQVHDARRRKALDAAEQAGAVLAVVGTRCLLCRERVHMKKFQEVLMCPNCAVCYERRTRLARRRNECRKVVMLNVYQTPTNTWKPV